ncbi:MAG TPA: hypothetical protein VNS52_07180 [Gemmatimonadaceae bacterium]|nr:hypothetical protein [Gemmatimonadaceae bacterium]
MRPFRLAALALAFASPLAAQEAAPHPDSSRSASDEQPPRVSYGTSLGGMSFADGHSAEALKGVLQFQATPWLVLSTEPALVRASDTTGTSAQSGFTDLPVSVGVSHSFAHAAWHPSLGLSGIVSLPTGDATVGLGTGQTELAADAAVGVAPRDGLDLRLGAWRGLSSGIAGTGLAGTSLEGEASYDVGGHASVNMMYGAELGASDSTYTPGKTLGGGMTYSLRGPLTMTVEGVHTLSGDGPRWGMSIGFGTAFAGLSTVGATSPLSRLHGAFARSGGRPGSIVGGGSCHATHTC